MDGIATPPTRALAVGDIMSRSVLTTEAGASVAEAAARTHERRVGSIVVVQGRTPIGILTERDLVRFAAGAADARTATVGDYMTAGPDTMDEWRRSSMPSAGSPRTATATSRWSPRASWAASSRCGTW